MGPAKAIRPGVNLMMRDDLPLAIRTYVTQYVARRRRVALLNAVAIAASMFLGLMLLECMIDRVLHLRVPTRLIALLAAVAACTALVTKPLRFALRRQFDWLAATAEVERLRPAFGERLITVASQLQSPTVQRGSSQILQHLAQSLAAEVSNERGSQLVEMTPARRSFIAVATLLLITLGLSFVQPLGLPSLMRRFIQPLAFVPAVTTTRLTVTPTAIDVFEGRPLRIAATAARLDSDAVPSIHLSDDGQSWSATAMTQLDRGEFVYDLTAVAHDVL
jgi:hypothetical protein